jgi:hypothetical protein
LKKAAQKLLLLWSRDVWAPVAQNKKVFLPHRRPGKLVWTGGCRFDTRGAGFIPLKEGLMKTIMQSPFGMTKCAWQNSMRRTGVYRA